MSRPSSKPTMLLLLLVTMVWGLVPPQPESAPLAPSAPQEPPLRFKRLTAFGKSPAQQSPPPLQGKGRECKSQADCEVIQYAECSLDTRDNRRRCICRDHTHPVNGQCPNTHRGLRQECNADAECIYGAECKTNPNSTAPANSRTKMCLCRVGYTENDHSCSDGVKVSPGSGLFLASLLALILTILTQ